MNVLIQYLLILNFLAPYNTLPHRQTSQVSQTREPRGTNVMIEESKLYKKDDCLSSSAIDSLNDKNKEECAEENQLPSKVLRCLNNCANCVKQWRTGVYNGRYCANDCMKQEHESMDPDCNLIKYFNSTLLASV